MKMNSVEVKSRHRDFKENEKCLGQTAPDYENFGSSHCTVVWLGMGTSPSNDGEFLCDPQFVH
jgi:hypothetical protein